MLTPSDRIKHLVDRSPSVSVDPNHKVLRYYRSGPQMVSRADMYLHDGNLEEAYLLYYKFIVLFVEHIRKHPNFNEVPVKMREENSTTLRDVMQKAEMLKEKLKQKYTKEYDENLKEQERQKQHQEELSSSAREEEERHKQELAQHKLPHDKPSVTCSQPPMWEPDINSQPTLSGLSFPKNFDVISPKPTQNVDIWNPEPLNNSNRTPVVDRSTKPVGLINSNQSSQRLKNVVVSRRLFEKFQNLARAATLKDIETCGILAGRSVGRDLVITHVLVPKQKGTSNSCTAENEEEVFDYQDQNNLITLGWIHTHPTQTAFLSSIDLHTHCPYQLMMPEAIAIVCAPKYKQDLIFSLTPDYGLDFIAKCRLSGFHPHPTDPPLFMVAEHVTLDGEREVEVIDLRSFNADQRRFSTESGDRRYSIVNGRV